MILAYRIFHLLYLSNYISFRAWADRGITMRKQPIQKEPEGAFSKRRILSNAEQSFFKLLKDSLPEYEIFSKIRLIDVIQNHAYKDGNRIIKKHIDFVVMDHSSLMAVAAIELDDSSDIRGLRFTSSPAPFDFSRLRRNEVLGNNDNTHFSLPPSMKRILTAKVSAIPYPSSSCNDDVEPENDSSRRKSGCAPAVVICALVLSSTAFLLHHFS